MSRIKSDLTNKTLTPNQMRELDVPDESGMHFEGNADIDFRAMDKLMASRGLPPLDPNIESAYNARQSAQRQLSDKDISELENELKEARRVKVTGEKSKLSSGARQRIEMLTGISRQTKEIEIDEQIYALKTLKSKEQREVMSEAYKFDMTVEFPFELRKQIMARSLITVAGTDIELFLNDSSLEAKLDFIEELDESLLNRLYNEYLLLIKESTEKYGLADTKEVVEDLKK